MFCCFFLRGSKKNAFLCCHSVKPVMCCLCRSEEFQPQPNLLWQDLKNILVLLFNSQLSAMFLYYALFFKASKVYHHPNDANTNIYFFIFPCKISMLFPLRHQKCTQILASERMSTTEGGADVKILGTSCKYML